MTNKLLPLLLLSLWATTSCIKKKVAVDKPMSNTEDKITAADLKADSSGLSDAQVVIKTAKGEITLKFYHQKAPRTVTRIIELVQQGFYDNIKFHRVVPGFVIQAGDPSGTGAGGSGKKLKAEFNDVQHSKGTVAMARAADKDSADSQFYIALNTLPHLDGKYTVFGQVVKGIEVLDKITQGDKIISMQLLL